MTIAICLRVKDEIFIASDGRVSTNEGPVIDHFNKWIFKNRWFIGTAGFLRTDALIREKLRISSKSSALAIMDRIKSLAKKDGYHFDHSSDGGPQSCTEQMLLVNSQGIWSCGSDFTPLSLIDSTKTIQYAAIGSGLQYALGYLFSAELSGELATQPLSAIKSAVICAMRFDQCCGGTCFYKKVDDSSEFQSEPSK